MAQIECVQFIGIRTITDMLLFVRNSILPNLVNFKTTQNQIRQQSKIMFYKNSFLAINQIRFLAQTSISLPTTKRKTNPNSNVDLAKLTHLLTKSKFDTSITQTTTSKFCNKNIQLYHTTKFNIFNL